MLFDFVPSLSRTGIVGGDQCGVWTCRRTVITNEPPSVSLTPHSDYSKQAQLTRRGGSSRRAPQGFALGQVFE